MPERWCAYDPNERPKRPVAGVGHDRLCDVVGRVDFAEARHFSIFDAAIGFEPVDMTAQSHAHKRLIYFDQDWELNGALFAIDTLANGRSNKFFAALKDFDLFLGQDAHCFINDAGEL